MLDFYFKQVEKIKFFIPLIIILSIFSFYAEFKLFLKWKNTKDSLVRIMENMEPGCLVLANLGGEGAIDSFNILHPIEYNSILLNPSRKIDKIVFRKRHEKACQFGNEKVIPIHNRNGKTVRLIETKKIQKSYFDFQEVLFTK